MSGTLTKANAGFHGCGGGSAVIFIEYKSIRRLKNYPFREFNSKFDLDPTSHMYILFECDPVKCIPAALVTM